VRRLQPRELLTDGLHLGVLSAFAIAEPLFSLLSKNADFFAARGSQAIDILLLTAVLTLGPALLLTLVEGLVGLVSRRARRGLHYAFVAALTALFLVQVLKRNGGGLSAVPLLALAALLGAGAATLYAHARALRSFLTVLAPAPLVFAALFLCFSPVAELVLPQPAVAQAAGVRTNTPIVMLVLDEFPGTDLMRPDGTLDAERYPGFARLAASSTWYPHATSIYDSTTQAVPALLSATYPRKGLLATYRDHPNNVFTLFGRGARTNVSEEATTLCPGSICRESRGGGLAARMGSLASDLSLVYEHVALPDELAKDLPSVSETWGDFGGSAAPEPPSTPEAEPATNGAGARARGKSPIRYLLNRDRPGRLDRWIASIRRVKGPSLNVKHALLPHVPLQYLPSGHAYRLTPGETVPGMTSEPSWDDQLLTDQSRQRHLLQVGFADHEIGKLIDHLRAVGVWDEALVVVIADHGVAYRISERRRRAVPSNLELLAPVPAFIKAPRQDSGKVSDVYLRTIDVLPTMASILHVRLPWAHDGRPATSSTVRKRSSVMMIRRDFSGRMVISAAEMRRRVERDLALKASLFGIGNSEPGIYGLGPHPELIGRALSELDVATASPGGPRAKLDGPELLGNVRRASGYVPAHVTGEIEQDAAGARHDLAIVVNGRVEAVTHSFYLKASTTQNYSAVVPERALAEGTNEVQVLLVEPSGDHLQLTRIGGT